MREILSLLVVFTLIPFDMPAQDLDDFRILDTIEVENGSFEEFDSEEERVLMYWKDCGDAQRTPPSIFRNGDPLLLPDEFAADGEYFLTLVTRDDSSWEAIGQELKDPLEAGKNYVLKCYLRKSYLESEADLLAQKESVEGPVVFLLKSIEELKDQAIDRNNVIEELGKSELVIEREWEEHTFVFRPKKDVKILMIEAFYNVPVLKPYRGHLFVDGISDIYEIE